MTKFAERITLLKEENGLNRRQLSEKTGLSKTNYYSWTHSEILPSGYSLICISDAFGVSADWLLGQTDVRAVPDKNEVSKNLEHIYTIQSPHLSAEGVIARKYYCEQLWKTIFGEESELPWWMS